MRVSGSVAATVLLLAGVALAISLYIMTRVDAQRPLPGCGSGGCGEVLNSRWQRWGVLSVATLGVGGYIALMVGIVATTIPQLKPLHTLAWRLMVIEGLAGIGFVVWLVCLQWLVIRHFCMFCLSSHAFGISAYALVIWKAPVWQTLPHPRLRLGGSAGAIVAILVAVHILAVPEMMAVEAADTLELADPGASEAMAGGMMQFGPKAKSRTVQLLNDSLTFDLYKVPVLGDRDAKYVLLELSDYKCPSCRKLHSRMHQYLEQHKTDLAIVYLPAPMNSECNPNIKYTPQGFEDSHTLARYSMAVNKADSTKFEAFHHYLMNGSRRLTIEDARKEAEALVGSEAFDTALKDKVIDEWIATGVGVQGYIKATTIPKLITGTQVISYSGGSKGGFAVMMKKALGTEP
jgi:uncharacterized membrane protein/protein-disulfide isomerase